MEEEGDGVGAFGKFETGQGDPLVHVLGGVAPQAPRRFRVRQQGNTVDSDVKAVFVQALRVEAEPQGVVACRGADGVADAGEGKSGRGTGQSAGIVSLT